jgi:hypothetical protein
LEKRPDNKQMLPKESPTHRLNDKPGYRHNWHWLIKHPVEFSKNNRTPPTEPLSQPALRGTRSTLPAVSALSNPRFATEFAKTETVPGTREEYTMSRATRSWGFGRTAGADLAV